MGAASRPDLLDRLRRRAAQPFRTLGVVAAFALMTLAIGAVAPADSPARGNGGGNGGDHKPSKRAAAPIATGQLRGVNLTPNWDYALPHGVDEQGMANEVRAACQLGSTVVRYFIKWNRLEPSRGRIDEQYAHRVDDVMADAAACGIKVLVNFLITPCWASSDPASEGGTNCTNVSTYVSPPRDLAEYGSIVERLLRRWPQIYALEVWNEPNGAALWRGSVADYVAMVNEAGAAADRAGSPVQILAGVLALGDAGYLRQMYAAGLRNYDGISFHPYDFRVHGDQTGFASQKSWKRGQDYFELGVKAIRREMVTQGAASKGMWLTEFGWSICPTQPYCVTDVRQARGLADSFRVASRWKFVRGLTAFSLRDIGEDTNKWDNRFGLLDRAFNPRPAFWTVRKTLRSLSGARAAKSVRQSRSRRSR